MPVSPWSLADLPWLPRPSGDLRSRLEAIGPRDADWELKLRSVATQYLGLNEAIAVARTLHRLRAEHPPSLLSTFRLGIAGNATTDFLKPVLEASALRHGISLEVTTSGFGQVMQDALDPASPLNRAGLDAVLLVLDHRGLPFRSQDASKWPVSDHDAALAELAAIREGFKANGGTMCMVQTLPAPPELLLGSLDVATRGTFRASIAAFNAAVASDVAARGDVLVDVEWLASCVGLDNWYDERYWHLARLPFAQRILPLYADFVTRLVAAIRGKSRKCLVLDLDNTLWGGVIGDDGIEGIALDQGDAKGEAFRAIQTAAADLRRRGVVLAVCSKNDEAVALHAFRSHPGMILKEDDIAAFMVNWDDKATNIERIAQQLELGVDSMVLLDDNPVERAQVREALPEVAVPELGADPSTYARILSAAGYFESVGFTSDDLARAEQYKSNASRTRLLQATRDLGEFLRSLDMRIAFDRFTPLNRKRITQLINKTNQFNLTTRRYTESQVTGLESSPEHHTLQVSVRDRFGDNGIIGIIICRTRAAEWEIDTWLMSCRVLNREVEKAICNRIVEDARRAGARRLIGTFVPTARNGMVKDLYASLGFEPHGSSAAGEQWVLSLDRYTPFEVPFAETTPATMADALQ